MSLVVEIQFKVIRSTDIPDVHELVGVNRGVVTLPDTVLSRIHDSKVAVRDAIETKFNEMLGEMSL